VIHEDESGSDSIRLENCMTCRPEAQLVECCRGGDAQAWEDLFDRHYAATGRFLAQMSPDFSREDVEEVCQEVFLSVVRNLEAFHGRSRLQTWIFRIAVNKAHDFRQKQRAAKRGGGTVARSLQEEDPTTGLTLEFPDSGLTPDLALLRSEHLDLVGRAVENLSGRYREVVELRYFANLSYEEIARELDLNPKTVSSRLSKSLDRLAVITRRLLAQAGIEVAAQGT
jgi:RNA polymerase sigma-70 factor (ECF subfamily)